MRKYYLSYVDTRLHLLLNFMPPYLSHASNQALAEAMPTVVKIGLSAIIFIIFDKMGNADALGRDEDGLNHRHEAISY